MNSIAASGVYEGWVRHRRYKPRPHAFRYKLYMLYIDLAELNKLFQKRWLWSIERRNVGQFRRSDYLGDPKIPLDQAVRDCVELATGRSPSGPIRLLTHLRYFGHCFNPVSFYYCYAEDGVTLDAIVAEITNTPWRERHAYVLPVADARPYRNALHWNFQKQFHVSPFLPMESDYSWRFTTPGPELRVHMNVNKDGAKEFDATLAMQRRPLNGIQLARCLLQYPLMTLKVVSAIHWQAMLLFLKRNRVYDHPSKLKAPSR